MATAVGANRPLRLLCVLSEVLGNRTYSLRLRDAVAALDFVEPMFVAVGNEDYARISAPAPVRASAPLHAEWIIRQKVGSRAPTSVDAVLTNGWEVPQALRRLVARVPFISSMDATPRLAAQMAPMRAGTMERALAATAQAVHHARFQRVAARVRHFLPQSRWCERSLWDDYRVPNERTTVLHCPLRLDVWSPKPHARGERMRLLFVGNDFVRKGGEFLLELFVSRLSGYCELTIASNDPILSGRSLPEGVRVLRGLDTDALLSHYRAADLLIVPTRRDMIGHVFGEAAAVGLPAMACDVGGVGELVRHEHNGFLLPLGAGLDEWSERIRGLWDHPEQHHRMRVKARQLAEECLAMESFVATLGSVLASVAPVRA